MKYFWLVLNAPKDPCKKKSDLSLPQPPFPENNLEQIQTEVPWCRSGLRSGVVTAVAQVTAVPWVQFLAWELLPASGLVKTTTTTTNPTQPTQENTNKNRRKKTKKNKT